ncbi:MAG: hypothetical protein KC656_04115 [Myxococcales bacterium]|nr:hypothetical protein [Myxococcales bacterium]MCA9566999.1 hypothetical protein [Myxococcales bacterium]MCB9669835.1 hypothetical protein [Alphaproteobacteria bacterium]MCB9694565.1 hypothetical protein [Alphaproteobacteria bacterium]
MRLTNLAADVLGQIADHHLGTPTLEPLFEEEIDADVLTNLLDDLDETFGLPPSDRRWNDVCFGGLVYLRPVLEADWDGETVRFVDDGGRWLRPQDR